MRHAFNNSSWASFQTLSRLCPLNFVFSEYVPWPALSRLQWFGQVLRHEDAIESAKNAAFAGRCGLNAHAASILHTPNRV